MKVLVNAVSARRGGIATYTRNIIATMPGKAVEAFVAAPHALAGVDPATTLTVEVGSYGPLRRFLWDQIAWRRMIHAQCPDVLFSSANFALLHSPVRQLLLMREGGLFNPYYIHYVFPRLGVRSRMMNRLRRQLMRLSVRNADLVMFPSETLRDWITEFEPSLVDRSVVNAYGIDVDRFVCAEPVAIDPTLPLRLAYVSVYYPHKDPLTLAEAVRILRARGRPAIARITMDSADFEPWPEMRSEYDDLARRAALGEIVLGSLLSAELPMLYRESDIFVFPSVSETFGFPLVEAMASAVPVIAADTLTNREICGPAAVYFPPSDPVVLADRIEMLAGRPDLARHLALRGRERARRLYTWQGHLDRLIGILERLACAAPARRH